MDPFITTLKEVEEIHSIIQAQNWGGKPIHLSIHSKNSQEMESYALCRSIFKRHLGEVLLRAYLRKSSWTRKMVSIIFQFLRKVDWDSPMIISSIGAIPLAKILDTILYNRLQQDIGLKWFTWEACYVLGMSAIMAWLICFKIFPEMKNSLTAAKILSPMMFQASLKNKAL